jgi:MFS family permease
MLFAAEFVSGFGVMALDICIGSIYAAVVPGQLMSRVMGAFQAVNYGTRPAGALAAGGLGTLIGLRPTLWLAAGAGTLGFLWLLPSPLPHYRTPTAPAQPAGDQPAGDQPAEAQPALGPPAVDQPAGDRPPGPHPAGTR